MIPQFKKISLGLALTVGLFFSGIAFCENHQGELSRTTTTDRRREGVESLSTERGEQQQEQQEVEKVDSLLSQLFEAEGELFTKLFSEESEKNDTDIDNSARQRDKVLERLAERFRSLSPEEQKKLSKKFAEEEKSFLEDLKKSTQDELKQVESRRDPRKPDSKSENQERALNRRLEFLKRRLAVDSSNEASQVAALTGARLTSQFSAGARVASPESARLINSAITPERGSLLGFISSPTAAFPAGELKVTFAGENPHFGKTYKFEYVPGRGAEPVARTSFSVTPNGRGYQGSTSVQEEFRGKGISKLMFEKIYRELPVPAVDTTLAADNYAAWAKARLAGASDLDAVAATPAARARSGYTPTSVNAIRSEEIDVTFTRTAEKPATSGRKGLIRSSAVKGGLVTLLLSNDDAQQGIESVAKSSSIVGGGLTLASWVLDAPGSILRSPLLNEKPRTIFSEHNARLLETNYGAEINTFAGMYDASFNLLRWNTREGYTGAYETGSRREMRLNGTLDDYYQRKAMEILRGDNLSIDGIQLIK